MSLPDLSNLSPLGWVVLIAIAVLCAVAVYVVEDEKKKGQKIPGHMCAGCQENGMVVSTEKSEGQDSESEDMEG